MLKYESKDVSQGSYREILNRLSVDAASYAQAEKALLDQDKVNTERLKELEELRSQMREFAEAVGSSDLLSYQGIQQIRDERLRISDFELRLKEASSKLSAFINLHPDIVDKQIEGPAEDFAETLKELKKRESQFIENHDKLLSMINECRVNERRLAKSVDLIPQLQDELDDLTAERSDLERRVFVLDSTKEMLAKAKESLSHKYLGPVVQAFDKYCSLLFGDSFSFRVDENLSITVEHKGDFKESAFLSAGLEDLVAVCMRMALVDALYPGEDMFIILDDPFVNLDDRNMRRALDLVERMSQYRQILYLTCHSSRMPC